MRKLTPKQAVFVREYIVDLDAIQAAGRAEYHLLECDGSVDGFYVYALIDPLNGNIFYVGKGKKRRYAAHYSEWKKGKILNPEKFDRIGNICQLGEMPKAVYLAVVETEEEAISLERSFIQAIGWHRLSNMAPGQFTEREKSMAYAKSLMSRIKPFDRWVSEKRRTATEIEYYHRIVEELEVISREGWVSEIVIKSGAI